MPMKPLRPCGKPGCGRLCRGSYCEDHRPKSVRMESEAWHHLYNRPDWKHGRAEFLAANPWCIECAKDGRRTRATVVDHIRPHRGAIELFLARSNWQPMCKKHHDAKTLAERRDRQRLARPRG